MPEPMRCPGDADFEVVFLGPCPETEESEEKASSITTPETRDTYKQIPEKNTSTDRRNSEKFQMNGLKCNKPNHLD